MHMYPHWRYWYYIHEKWNSSFNNVIQRITGNIVDLPIGEIFIYGEITT